MTMTPVQETHIYLDEKGKAYVKPSNFKVRMIIQGLRAYEESPDDYVKHFPDLTVAEVYAALTYYHDHRAEMDEEIKSLATFTEELRKNTPECEAARRVREAMERR